MALTVLKRLCKSTCTKKTSSSPDLDVKMFSRDGGPIAALLGVVSKVDEEVFRRLEEGELARCFPFLSTKDFLLDISEVSLVDISLEGTRAGGGLAQSLVAECTVGESEEVEGKGGYAGV